MFDPSVFHSKRDHSENNMVMSPSWHLFNLFSYFTFLKACIKFSCRLNWLISFMVILHICLRVPKGWGGKDNFFWIDGVVLFSGSLLCFWSQSLSPVLLRIPGFGKGIPCALHLLLTRPWYSLGMHVLIFQAVYFLLFSFLNFTVQGK